MQSEHETKITVTEPTPKAPTAASIFLKATALSILFAGILLFLTGLAVAGFGYYKLNQFAQKADTSVGELSQIVQSGLEKTPEQTNGYKTILLLGVDTVSNKPDSPKLTDTLLLATIDMNSGHVRTLSLPRDLWSQAYQTKINALYHYGEERYPGTPQQFSTEVIEELTGLSIHHTILLTLNNVSDIVDILGGITVTVEEGFTDTEFPREDVDLATATPDELYETVVFEPGEQTMDGNQVLKYIRSRKSADITQGTDIARAERQQQVIESLTRKLLQFSVITDTDTLAALYKYYNQNFEQQFSKIEAIATVSTLYPHRESIEFTPHSLSVFPEDETGVITNPPLRKYQGQWVYEIIDPQSFQSEVQAKLYNNSHN